MTATYRTHRDAAMRNRDKRRRSGPVTTTKVHPLALATALRLAGGDASRLVIVSATEIIVTNHPR